MKTEDTRRRALRIIGARDMSKGELIKRLLEKGECEEDAADAADWLEELRLLDDEKYAGMVARHYAAKGYGERRIRHELYRRLVPSELWDDALQELPEADDIIDRLLRSRLSESPDRAEKKKAADFLARRGFPWGEIKDALARFELSSD